MWKKIVGAVIAVLVIGLVWFFTQGPGKDMMHKQEAAAASAAAVSTPTPPPPGFKEVQDALQSIKANGVVRVSNQDPSDPFYSSNGAPHGFNVDFAHLLFSDSSFKSPDHSSVNVDFGHSVSEYAEVPKQLLKKSGDGYTTDIAMDGLTFADNTPDGVVYSVPYIDDFGYALIVQKGSAITSTADLAGKTVGVLKGDPDVKAFVTKEYPGVNFVEVDDADAHFIDHAIDSGKVAAFIYDYPFAVESIKGTDLQFAVTHLDDSSIAYKIGVRSSDQTLLVYLNAAIAKVKQTDAYKALLLKYFVSNQVVTKVAVGSEKTYTVKPGDTLFKIAQSKLGDGNRYREIQKRNNLPNPNLISVGQSLVIPK